VCSLLTCPDHLLAVASTQSKLAIRQACLLPSRRAHANAHHGVHWQALRQFSAFHSHGPLPWCLLENKHSPMAQERVLQRTNSHHMGGAGERTHSSSAWQMYRQLSDADAGERRRVLTWLRPLCGLYIHHQRV
jgi:hypothetical protein